MYTSILSNDKWLNIFFKNNCLYKNTDKKVHTFAYFLFFSHHAYIWQSFLLIFKVLLHSIRKNTDFFTISTCLALLSRTLRQTFIKLKNRQFQMTFFFIKCYVFKNIHLILVYGYDKILNQYYIEKKRGYLICSTV